MFTVGDDEERHLGSGQHLFKHDAGAGVTEAAIDHRGIHGSFGSRAIGCHDDALAACQSVGLHHECIAKLAGADGSQRLVCGHAHAIVRGRHVMPLHEVLSEGLAGLELCGSPGRAEYQPAFGGEPVGQPAAERGFRADHGQVDPFALDQPNHGIGVEDVERLGGGGGSDSGVARSAE